MSNELKNTLFGEMMQMMESCREDYIKAKRKGIKVAGSRVRSQMLSIKKLAQNIREELKNGRSHK